MRATRGRLLRALGLLVVLLPGRLAAEEAEGPARIAEQADYSMAVGADRQLAIRGVHGTLALRLAKTGELRFAARTLDSRREPRALALWREGEVLVLKPPSGHEAERVVAEVGVPPEMSVTLDTEDSRVDVSGLGSAVVVRGARVDVVATALAGNLEIEADSGKVLVKSAAQDVSLSGRDLRVDVQGVKGSLGLKLREGGAKVNYAVDVDADLKGTSFAADSLDGPLHLEMDGAKVELQRCLGGGELRLVGAELGMRETRGSFQIDTDSDLTFTGHEGALAIHSDGGIVRGSQVHGEVDIEADGGEVVLDGPGGPTHVQGSDLTLTINDATDSVDVTTTGSKVQLNRIKGPLVVDGDFGAIEIHEALKSVEVTSRGGEVRLDGLRGPVQLSADTSEASVTWVGFDGTDPSNLQNEGGDLRLVFPANAVLNLRAEAPFGRVECELPGLTVSEDGHSVTGLLNASQTVQQVKKPGVFAHAGGDLYVSGSVVQRQPPRPPRQPPAR